MSEMRLWHTRAQRAPAPTATRSEKHPDQVSQARSFDARDASAPGVRRGGDALIHPQPIRIDKCQTVVQRDQAPNVRKGQNIARSHRIAGRVPSIHLVLQNQRGLSSGCVDYIVGVDRNAGGMCYGTGSYGKGNGNGKFRSGMHCGLPEPTRSCPWSRSDPLNPEIQKRVGKWLCNRMQPSRRGAGSCPHA